MRICFAVPGAPQGKARPKFGNGRAYTPKNTVAYEKLVRLRYQQSALGLLPVQGPVSVKIAAYYPIPKSASKPQRLKMTIGSLVPTKKPDADNVAKIICDALNGIAYRDDAQIVSLTVHKRYSEMPEVVVEVKDENG